MPESSKSDSRVSGHLFVCQETIDTPALRGAPSTYYICNTDGVVLQVDAGAVDFDG